MPLVLPNEGLADQLRYILSEPCTAADPWRLVLWVNDLVPDQATRWVDLVEATFPGYARVTMLRNLWTAPVLVDNRARTQWKTTPTNWTCNTTGQRVYGYAMVSLPPGLVRGVERFDQPVDVEPGGTLGVVPRYEYTTLPQF